MAKKVKVHKKNIKSSKENQASKKIDQNQDLKEPIEQLPPNDEGKSKDVGQLALLTQSFHKQLGDFLQLYKELLALKHPSSDYNIQEQLNHTLDRVTKHIENQALSIFKNRISELIDWIKSELEKKELEVKQIETVYGINKDSLSNSGQFSEQQIQKQLEPINEKVQAKKKEKHKVERLLEEAKQMFV